MSCCCCRVAAGDRMLALPCSFFLLWKNHSPVHTFARYYEELTLNSTSRLIIDANLPTFFSPVSTTYLYIIRSVGRVPSFFLSSSSYLILIHFSFIFLFFLFLSLVSPRFPEWVGVKKKGGGCRWWWVVVVVPAAGLCCSRSAGLGCWHQQSSKHFCPVSFNFPRSVSSQRRDHSHTQVESVSSTPFFLFILLGRLFLNI